MWVQFFFAALLAVGCLLLPGFLVARGIGARAEFALGVAPLVTLACYGVMSIVFGATGIPCGWFSLPLPLIVIGAAMWVVARRRDRGVELGFSAEAERPFAETGLASWLSPVRLGMLLAVAAAIATSLAVYVLNIGEPDAFIQNYDNAAHLSRIHLFATTQNYSTLLGGDVSIGVAWHCRPGRIDARRLLHDGGACGEPCVHRRRISHRHRVPCCGPLPRAGAGLCG